MYVSLKDVAARSGVSFQTASKVLNGHSGVVAPATRERILAAARELGYVPNALARGLVRQASYTIGILADDFSDLALSKFVVAAERTAGEQGHASLVVSARSGGDAATSVRKLLEHRVDGIVVIAPSVEDDDSLGDALRSGVPAVSLNHIPGGGVPVVGSSHSTTGSMAGTHLAGLGHREIGTVTGPRNRRVTESRLRGFRDALAQEGLPLPSSRVATADWTYAGAHRVVRGLLDAEPGVTALFVQNDVMAMGALAALREKGRRVPEDCSLVGCDDLPFAPFLTPPLTTVHVPFEETGSRAATLLLAHIRGETTSTRELLPVRLVVRSSTTDARPGPRGTRPHESAPVPAHPMPVLLGGGA